MKRAALFLSVVIAGCASSTTVNFEKPMKVDQTMALKYAEEYLSADKNQLAITLVTEYDFGWVCFYNSKKFVKTGDEKFALEGNSPIVVNRDGKVEDLGNSMDDPEMLIEERLEEWRQNKGK